MESFDSFDSSRLESQLWPSLCTAYTSLSCSSFFFLHLFRFRFFSSPPSTSLIFIQQPHVPDSHFTHRPQPTDTIMGQGFLQAIRGCLVLLAFITFILIVHAVRIYRVPISDSRYWDTWLPFFLAILSIIAYSWAIKAQRAQKNIIQSNSARYIGSILFCAAWLASPSNAINELLIYLRRYGMEKEFFRYWDCGMPECNVGFAIDIGSFLVAFFVLLEVILAYLYERSSNIHEAGTLPTTTVVAPGPVQQYPVQPVQQYPAQPVQQFVYNPVQQQPGQPAAYYHQPVMTAPYQQGPITTPYQVPQQAPPYQPYPTPTH
ncbi:MAG: hypothetical protein J3Q66DRAFT_442426 [Benniella sp.]|nr:MAG: hypothetical protein J3Q66DRAFT_442426 [Benniella sp.]